MAKVSEIWGTDVCRQNRPTRIDQVLNILSVTESQVTMFMEGAALFLMMFVFVSVWVATGN